jgi:hypothetical protein
MFYLAEVKSSTRGFKILYSVIVKHKKEHFLNKMQSSYM